ncbi:LysR family transcriptional regulator ArgP [Rhizobium sp. RM]|uniref:LysR family transcriptional regulator ArgP n=1 Tax=Rhizobium sp. RM TaxID=2748079 RepID=UPI00110E3C00|nr:LysR family transcriptional regulator ArgP [Rhizobium sp. RM]NWJ25209.1 LysR family transcriptional regulator ArgP [Rhizobium sp. RM]TMV16967.1 LysR family transcriptional regulator ArgP [Rhizobium sp. Td3]
MIDYPSMRAVALVAQTGSFEKAAAALFVTPSAVSQRVKQLEERLGVVLIVRGTPCTATEKGEWLCRHMEQVGMLETELFRQLPTLAEEGATHTRVTLNVATNADSLGTWFLDAVSAFSRTSDFLVNIAVDDQDHTVEWLQRGKVLAAVTAHAKPVQGCRVTPLGILRFHATASPDFMRRFFPDGVTATSLAAAPGITFNQKDRLQNRWIKSALGRDMSYPTHWLPSTDGFVKASLSGIGWGMNPNLLVKDHLEAGRLLELIPGIPLDIPLYWQVNRMAADRLSGLTASVVSAARAALLGEV